MKKTSIFLVAMIAIGCISCGNNREPSQNDSTLSSSSSHSHRIITHEGKEPTCLEDGYETYYTCETCDYSTYERIPALGHKYEKKIIIENGETTVRYICSRCGDVYEENCKIELADGFDIDYGTKQYPTISKTVSNSETSIALSSAIIVSKECTWTLSKDIEGKDIIKTKNMSLNTGHNYAYITVWFANEEYNTVYYVDIYRLSMFTYTIKSDNNIIKRETVEENTLIDEPSTQNKEGYSFVTWQDDKNQSITFPYAIKRNVTISAKWKISQYKITFDTDGGSEISQLKLDYQESISVENPTKEGYTFIGWEPELPSTMPANDISVRAKWSINQYTITFDTLGGNDISSITQDYNTKIEKPNDPIKEGHTFMGWNPEIPDVMPATNMVITAKWDVNTYTITFDTDGGTEEESITQEFGSTIKLPNNSKKENSVLFGWEDQNGNVYEVNTSITLKKNMYLKAIWISKDFKYSRNGDGTITITKYTGSDEEIAIPSVTSKIEKNAFKDCTFLISVVIPNSVTSVGDSAFSGCSSLTIYCERKEKLSLWSSYWKDSNCPVVWEYAGKYGTYNNLSYAVCSKNGNQYITVLGNNQSNSEVKIPESINGIVVTTIAENAFNNYTSLTSIIIPSSVTDIKNYAFEGCTALTSIVIPNSVINMGYNAFKNCTSLTIIYCESESQPSDWHVSWKDSNCIVVWGYAGKYGIYDNLFYAVCSKNGNQYITILGYDCCNAEVEIPESIDGIPVTTIDQSAFSDCKSLNTIVLPCSVTSIGERAFSGCTSLTSIVIPNSVTSIGSYAFSGCTSLTSIEIPSSVTDIKNYAFEGCTALTSIVIPNSVINMGYNVFKNCTSLTIIYCEKESRTSGWNLYWNEANCPVVWGYAGKKGIYNGLTYIALTRYGNKYIKILDYDQSNTEVEIPESIDGIVVTTIDEGVFRNYTALTSVVIPSSVTRIGKGIFEGCSSLESITLPYIEGGYLGYIFGASSYKENNTYVPASLKEVIILNRCTYIKEYAFSGCASLTSVVIPNSVTTIGYYAFSGCKSLTSIEIPSSVTSIGSYAFSGCTSLKSIVIPKSITYMSEYAFSGCASLTIFCEAESQPSGWSKDWNNYFNYSKCHVIWEYAGKRGIYEGISYVVCSTNGQQYIKIFDYDQSNTKVEIPESIDGIPVTTIDQSAFSDCKSLNTIVLPCSVTSIGERAFSGCTSLTSIVIPNSVTSIGSYAFSGCTSLTSIEIPSSVTSIGSYAFSGCTSLKSIVIPKSITYIAECAFSGCKSLTNIEIQNGVTTIGYYAFAECKSLTSIEIPSSVTGIGGYAFSGCTSLKSIVIPSSVTIIGKGAFYDCNSLESITLPFVGESKNKNQYLSYIVSGTSNLKVIILEGCTSIEAGAFSECTFLTSIEIPSSVTSIGSSAFRGCTSLTSIVIPNSVTSIEWFAFDGCTSLKSIVIPKIITYIGNYAFRGCTSLTSIVIPSSVTSIGDCAFDGCTSLTSIIIPNSVTIIRYNAFSGCSSLTIYCEAESQPSGWSKDWNNSNCPVVWNYKK